MALRTDSSKSHEGFRERYASTVLQPGLDPENTYPATSFQASKHKGHPTQDRPPDPPVAQGSPTQSEPLSSDIAKAKDSPPYTTWSGRKVKKPVRLDL